jgi:hypothetical protein
MRTDGPTDIHDEANSRFSQFCKRDLKKKPSPKSCLKVYKEKKTQISDIPGSATRRFGNAIQITRVSPGQEEK